MSSLRTAALALTVLVALSFASTDALATDEKSMSVAAPVSRALRHKGLCFRRIQVCCYRFFPCGVFCKPKVCVIRRVCVLLRNNRCIRYQRFRICTIRCFTRLCPRLRCSWLRSKRLAKPRPRLSKKYKVRTTRTKMHN
eukprot:IDg21478t1